MQKGSIILKAVHSPEDKEKVAEYLQQHAKNISPQKIPELLQKLPVVLARNISEITARMVIAELRRLNADASFISERSEIDQKTLENGVPTAQSKTNKIRLGNITSYLKVNKELPIILTMVCLAGLLNYSLASQYLILGFYTLPAIMAAYYFGRRQAVLTALASILLVTIIYLINPERFDSSDLAGLGGNNQWYHITSWGSILLVTAYAMGTLYKKLQDKIQELRRTYQGVLFILRHFITQDEDTENHGFRVSIFSVRIAVAYGLEEDVIEDIRSTALLHDLGQVSVNRDILSKAAYIIKNNIHESPPGESPPEKQNNPLKRILPMLVGYHPTKNDQNNEYQPQSTNTVGAQIIAAADRYDTLVTTDLYGTVNPEQTAKNIIVENKDNVLSAKVVEAFTSAFDKGQMDIPKIIV